VDAHGDALGVAHLPGDRWRHSHDALKFQIYLDARFLGIQIQSEVYGLFTHHHSDEGRTAYGNLSQREKRLQTIVPDLVTANHPEGSVLQTPGPQMHEIKRIQSILSFNRITGISTGQNDLYKARLRSSFVRATDRRVNKIPAEYKAKARAADARFVGGGSGRIPNALNAMPEVKGIAFGALGEVSNSVNVLIDGFAHEGALKNPDRFGQSNYKAAYGVIHWWLKRRWSRLAVITAVASRHDALRYVGGAAQRQAATQHARAQEQDDWRVDGAFREAESEGYSQGWGARFNA